LISDHVDRLEKSRPPEAEEGTADTVRRGQKRKSGTPEAVKGAADTARPPYP